MAQPVSPTSSSTTGVSIVGAPALGGFIGTNTGTDPLDSSPYIVFAFIAKL